MSKNIMIIGAVCSIFFSLCCLLCMVMLPESKNGMLLYEYINEFGLLSEKSIVISVIVSFSVELYKKQKKMLTFK